jgi:hypothetical protein
MVVSRNELFKDSIYLKVRAFFMTILLGQLYVRIDILLACGIKVITKLPNSEQSYKGKVKTHNYINRQNQSTTGKM